MDGRKRNSIMAEFNEHYERKLKAMATIIWDLTTKLYAEGFLSINEEVAIKVLLADGETDQRDRERYDEVVNYWVDKSNKRRR